MEDDIVITCIRTIVVKTCSTAATLAAFIGLRLLDLVGLVFNVAALCTITRAYPLVHMLFYLGKKETRWFPIAWRAGGILQLLIFIMDIPFWIMLAVISIFFWRLIIMIKDHREDSASDDWFDSVSFDEFGFIGFALRRDILLSFIGLLTDIFIIPFAVILLFSWRSCFVIMELKCEKRDFYRKRIILWNFFLLVLDIIVFIMFLIQMFSWRITVMFHIASKISSEYKEYKEKVVGNINVGEAKKLKIKHLKKIQFKFRKRVFCNFLRLILDILMLPIVLLLLLSWRCPVLIKKFIQFNRRLNEGNYSRWEAELSLRGSIMVHFFRYCIDLLMLIPILIVMCSWRCPILVPKFGAFFKSPMKWKDEVKLRKTLLFHALQVFIDVLSIPPVIISLFTWRLIFFTQIFPLNQNKSMAKKFKKVRFQFWIEAGCFILDIPVIVAAAFIVGFSWCFPWRVYEVFKYLSKLKRAYQGSDSTKWWVDRKQCEIRQFILITSLYTLCDLFVSIFAIFIAITLWRLPFLINKISLIKNRRRSMKSTERTFDFHAAVFKQFALLLLDFVMFLCLIIILGTLWRIPPMVRKMNKHTKVEDDKSGNDDEGDEDTDDEELQPVDTINTVVDDLQHGTELDATTCDVETTDATLENARPEVQADSCLFRARGWKIRKAILMNTVGLLLDIPALIMLLLNTMFIYQIPFILQRFLECGDFYQEFFFIMVDETSHLMQDIAFFLIFAFLSIVRPIQAWVNLLEDKNHFTARKSRECHSVIKHVIKGRFGIQKNIESVFSVFVKYHKLYVCSPDSIMKRFIDEENVYLSQIKEIRDKLLDEDLDDKLIFYMANIYFHESKKPYLYARRYKVEELFCLRACVAAREQNLRLCKDEMAALDGKLDNFYTEMESYEVPRLPLWTEKTGFLQRTRKQNQKVIIDTMTSGYFGIVGLFLLNCLFIYRIPVMIREMMKVSYCRYRVRDTVLKQTREYMLDWLALLKVLLVVIFIYRCPSLISDLVHDLFSKRSISAARKTIDRYPVDIFDDIFNLIRLLFQWDTVVFCFAFILFIILIPLSVLINAVRGLGINIVLVFILAIPLYCIIMSGPFLIVHKVTDIVLNSVDTDDFMISYAIVAFLGLVMVILIGFVIVQTKCLSPDDKHLKSIDYIRFNWFNAQVVFLEILEVIHLLALIFSIRGLVIPYAEQIRTVAQYILLDVYDFKARLGISVIIFAVWVIICTVPSLLEGVTKKVPKGHFSQNHFAWRSFLSLFGVTLFITLPEMSMSFLACNYSNCTNATICPSLIEDPDVKCWTGDHVIIASMTLFMMIWYVFTSLLFCFQYTDVSNKKVDLQFSSPYSALINLVKLIIVIAVSIFSHNKLPLLVFIGAIMIVLMITSILFPVVTGMAVCNAKALLIWRIEIFFTALLFCLGTLAFEIIDMWFEDWSESTLIFGDVKLVDFAVAVTVLALWLISLLVALILSKCYSEKTEQEKARSEFKKLVRSIVKPKIKEHLPDFISHWSKVSQAYIRMLDVVRMAHKNDKSFHEPVDKYVPVVEAAPPPPYDPELLDLPPPPCYESLAGVPDRSLSPGLVEVDSAPADVLDIHDIPASREHSDDECFLPTPAMYVSDIVGDYENFDATLILEKIKRQNPDPGGIFKAGWILDETVPGAKEKQLTDTHCTGIDLLLLLEEHIAYTSFSYEFITSIDLWREEVKQSNWIGLRDCVMKLQDNLTASYTKPKFIVKAEESDMLLPHTDTSHLPPYVPMSDLTEIKLKLHRKGSEKLMMFLPEPWVTIFRRLIPSSDSCEPLIFKVTLGSEDENDLFNIRVEMFRELEITIKGVGPTGFKAAVGASIVLPNPIVISRIRKSNKRIYFGQPYPYGKKGMLSKNITSGGTKLKNGVFSLVAAGRSVKLSKVIDTLAELEWKFRD